MKPVEDTRKLIKEIVRFLEQSPWKDIYISRLEVLNERVSQPCELAIAGRVKAGKSSFLNAYLGDDLAMVGTTETTATINFFKYGKPLDENHPVKVIWEDGREEWETRAFLDSLQGNSPEVLRRASGIDHLEYFIDNEKLRDITLIDTPGTGALVGEHEERVNDYFSEAMEQLREKHNAQSVALKEKADAVIVITERVPTNETSKLVSRFNCGTKSFNSIGVMTKIDLESTTSAEDWTHRCGQYLEHLKDQLSMIVPVSAGVYRAVKTLKPTGKLAEIKERLSVIPLDEFDDIFDGNRNNFYEEDGGYNDYYVEKNLPVVERKRLVGSLDWMVFCRLAKTLYHNSLEDAEKILIDYSGMELIATQLDKQFLNRSRIIRCAKIVEELHQIVKDLSDRHLKQLRTNAFYKNDFIGIINRSNDSLDVKTQFLQFVNDTICSQSEYEKYVQKINQLIRSIEALQLQFAETDKNTEAILLIEQIADYLYEEEIDELKSLFTKNWVNGISKEYVASRQMYWRVKRQMASANDYIKFLDLVLYSYSNIKFE